MKTYKLKKGFQSDFKSVDVLTTYFALVNSVSWNVFVYDGRLILAGWEFNFKSGWLSRVDLNLANSKYISKHAESKCHKPNWIL